MSTKQKIDAPRRASLREQVLLAALDCSGGDPEKTFTLEDLIVAAWKRDRFAWGLPGYEQEHPAGDRLRKEIDSRGAREENQSTGHLSSRLCALRRSRISRLTPSRPPP